MGKRNRLRQARRQQAEINVCAVLAAHAKRKSDPAVAVTYGDFAPEYRARIEACRTFALRPPEMWRCRLKSRSQERRLIDLVRFAFARYPAPAHLERTWISEVEDDFVDDIGPCGPRIADGRQAAARPDLRRWYLIATQGGSLHKQAAHRYLSKLETHHFLAAPDRLSTERAFWYAIARASSGDTSAALRVAQTRLADYSVASAFWRDVARFFARQPTTIAEMPETISSAKGSTCTTASPATSTPA